MHVSGYTRADGTYVHDYYRSAPGTSGPGGASPASSSVRATATHESGGGQGTPSASGERSWQPSRAECEFKPVLTDEEIARCR